MILNFDNFEKNVIMEVRLDIGINQLIGLIKQLPKEQKLKIKKEVDKELKEKGLVNQNNDLTDILLSGPVMSKEEAENFEKFNKEFNKWAKNLSA